MRELTKSVLSFSWGLPLFGFSQLANSASPQRAAAAFDGVTRAAQGQLIGPLADGFAAGDRLQREMVDLMFAFFGPELLDPGRIMQRAGDIARRSVEAAGSFVPGCGGCGQGRRQS